MKKSVSILPEGEEKIISFISDFRIWAVSAEQHAQCIKILDSASVYLSGFPNVFTVDNYLRVQRNLSIKLMNGFKGTYR